jgi:ribosome-binding ATPase YchF (GTP1/OBG family)
LPLEIGIVGPPNAGKTTLFNALTHAGVAATPYESVGAKPNVGFAPIPDERLGELARTFDSAKVTDATFRVVDPPGMGAPQLGDLRKVDALIAVLDAYSPDADPASGLESLRLELLVADRDHVERRLDRVTKLAKSGDPRLRDEVEELTRLLDHVDQGRTLAAYPSPLPPELEPLTTKPLVPIENGPGGTDLALEAELDELDEEEAAAFREGPSALDEVLRRLREALGLITFFTANDKEARAWTLRRGQTALEAAASIHSDIARGFIRCEVVRWDDLVAAGSYADAARRGVQRLEGKEYAVEDGDVLAVRFSPPQQARR